MLADNSGGIAPIVPRRAWAPASGFTLLEIVVALAIAGLALVGLFQAGSGGLIAVDAAGRLSEATQRAQSHLAAVGRTAAITTGETEGDDGDGYRWRVRARPLAAWQVEVAAVSTTITLFEIEVTITWKAIGGRRTIMLSSRRIG